MKIITCCKIVPNEEEIKILSSRELSMEDASYKISQYDLNALESGRQLAVETGGTLTALSIGGSAALEATKIRKDVLSRGADELHLVIDDSHSFSDSYETAKTIAGALTAGGEYDLVLCGMGSSDMYAQEVGVQVGTLLDVPTVNNVTGIKVSGEGMLEVERTLEDEVELLSVPLPAVLSVSSEINIPSVPSMREIMRAGKKPVTVLPAVETTAPSTRILEELAPMQQERRQEIIEGDNAEAVEALVSFLKKEGLS